MAALHSIDTPVMCDKTCRFLVVASCLLLLAQTLPYFESRWVEDESWYSIPAYTFMRTGELRNPTFPPTDSEAIADVRPPLMPLSLAFFFRILGVNVFAARIGELSAAVATLLAVYAIGKSLGRPDAGALAALALAGDNFLFLAARTARPEAWVTFTCTLGLLLLIRSKMPPSALMACGSGVAVGIACNYHVAAIGYAAGMVLLLIYDER